MSAKRRITIANEIIASTICATTSGPGMISLTALVIAARAVVMSNDTRNRNAIAITIENEKI